MAEVAAVSMNKNSGDCCNQSTSTLRTPAIIFSYKEVI